MGSELLYIFGSVLLVSLISVLVVLPIYFKKNVSDKLLIALLSLSVGSLLGAVFIHFIPEAIRTSKGYMLSTALYILGGFLAFFLLERLVHFHHKHKTETNAHGHSHGYHLALVNLLGDGLHNFLDGMVIAASYVVSIPLGIAATISIMLHEIPQEVADFGILIYSGMSRKKALIFNFVSALTSVVGAIIALLLIDKIPDFNRFIIPFAAGNFLYIAASNLLPELHRHCKMKDTFIHIGAILIGIGFMVFVSIMFPAHAHA